MNFLGHSRDGGGRWYEQNDPKTFSCFWSDLKMVTMSCRIELLYRLVKWLLNKEGSSLTEFLYTNVHNSKVGISVTLKQCIWQKFVQRDFGSDYNREFFLRILDIFAQSTLIAIRILLKADIFYVYWTNTQCLLKPAQENELLIPLFVARGTFYHILCIHLYILSTLCLVFMINSGVTKIKICLGGYEFCSLRYI